MEAETTSDLSIDTDETQDPKTIEIPGGGRKRGGGDGGGGGGEKREGSKI